MYVLEESDCAIVPMKLTNNEDKTSAEPAEGRAQTKENDAQSHTHPTQGGKRVSQGLGGVCAKRRRTGNRSGSPLCCTISQSTYSGRATTPYSGAQRLEIRGQHGLDPKLETLKIGTNCSERRFGWQSEYSVWSFAAPLPSGF